MKAPHTTLLERDIPAQAIQLGLVEMGSEEVTLDFQDHFESLGYTFLSCADGGEHFIALLDAH